LLGKIVLRNLQLDNKFSTKSLCFIITKTDTSINVNRHLKTYPDVATSLQAEDAHYAKHLKYMSDWKAHLNVNLKNNQAEKQQVKKLKKEQQQLEKSLEKTRAVQQSKNKGTQKGTKI
jgi:hypothetical protein